MKWCKRERPTKPVYIDGDLMFLDEKVVTYVESLRNSIAHLNGKLAESNLELAETKEALDAIKPIISSGDYKPAISRDCVDCKYAVRSSYSGGLLGCRKDLLCPDFVPTNK